MTTIEVLRTSGTFRVFRLHDGFVDLRKFRKTDYYQMYYEGFGIRDQLIVRCPISPEVQVRR